MQQKILLKIQEEEERYGMHLTSGRKTININHFTRHSKKNVCIDKCSHGEREMALIHITMSHVNKITFETTFTETA